MLAKVYLLTLLAVAAAAPLNDCPPEFRYIHLKKAPHKCVSSLKGGRGGYENTVFTIRECMGTARPAVPHQLAEHPALL